MQYFKAMEHFSEDDKAFVKQYQAQPLPLMEVVHPYKISGNENFSY